MKKELKPGMLLWLKSGKSHQTTIKITNEKGETTFIQGLVQDPKKEVRIIDIEFNNKSEKEPLIIYYEVGVLGNPVNSRSLKDFEWHPNNRICFNCRKPLSQTSENICSTCGGVHCDVDGFCLCDHPIWGERYSKK